MEAAFTESIREVKAEGRSVLLSSHIFAEVERLADRVTIIRDGVTVESGHHRRAAPPHPVAGHRRCSTAAPTGSPRCPGCTTCSQPTATSRSRSTTPSCPTVLAAVAQLRPRSLVANPPSLEELFLRHYGDRTTTLEPAAQPTRSGR